MVVSQMRVKIASKRVIAVVLRTVAVLGAISKNVGCLRLGFLVS